MKVTVHGEPTVEGYQYCMGLKRAFQSLISERYRSYIFTVGCIAVGINYCADNGHFSVLTHMLEMFMVKVTLEGHVVYELYHLQTT